jgi:hypothetical protein
MFFAPFSGIETITVPFRYFDCTSCILELPNNLAVRQALEFSFTRERLGPRVKFDCCQKVPPTSEGVASVSCVLDVVMYTQPLAEVGSRS